MMMMKARRRIAMWGTAVAAATVIAVTPGPVGAGRGGHEPVVTPLASFGSGLGSGSTIGPDGGLYVTDGNAGAVLRVDRRTGAVSPAASGLPPQVLGIGGATDVVFRGRTMYVLVTMVGGDLVGSGDPVHFGDAVDGIYRLEADGSFTVVADIGEWSAAHPPHGAYFITTGVQYALDTYRHGFLVTDGHHNRVLLVGLDGSVSEAVTLGNTVPTGLETSGRRVYLAEAGAVPHDPADAKVAALDLAHHTATEVASGRGDVGPGLTVDVERGPANHLYALLQGVWDLPPDPGNAGAPASHDTGALVRVEDDGTLRTIVEGLDQPTSMEIRGRTAYVVTLRGDIVRIRL